MDSDNLHKESDNFIKTQFMKIENCCLKIIEYNSSKYSSGESFNIPILTSRLEHLVYSIVHKLHVHVGDNFVPIIDNGLMPEKSIIKSLFNETRKAKSNGYKIAVHSHILQIPN